MMKQDIELWEARIDKYFYDEAKAELAKSLVVGPVADAYEDNETPGSGPNRS
jgi:hypothetical protein